MSNLVRYSLRLAIFILVQVFVLNQLPPLHSYFSPSIYFLFILWLPFTISRGNLLMVAFITGLALDVFTKTPGLHIAPCVLIAYLRPFIINVLLPQQGAEFNYREPSVTSMGFLPYAIYVVVLTFFHHFYLFALEAFQFGDMLYLLMKTAGSLIISVVMIVIAEMIFVRKQKFITNT